jgi:hypothetical protein
MHRVVSVTAAGFSTETAARTYNQARLCWTDALQQQTIQTVAIKACGKQGNWVALRQAEGRTTTWELNSRQGYESPMPNTTRTSYMRIGYLLEMHMYKPC